jgi:hypothetical protein
LIRSLRNFDDLAARSGRELSELLSLPPYLLWALAEPVVAVTAFR